MPGQPIQTRPVSLVEKWDKTFAESAKVTHRKVTFQNRYGITLVGDLYIPKDRGERKLAAIAVSGPFGAVKGAVQRSVCADPGGTGFCHPRLRSFLYGGKRRPSA
ncbi:membrane protein [Klebsiella michiganensis]|uniref:Membrane protein n=1 Tax=Klebsiella michiganensis TaxID=1134687 RepID=A0A7H4N085_9ENTR|nr:membrane protein [Klebsiella michiganensis]